LKCREGKGFLNKIVGKDMKRSCCIYLKFFQLIMIVKVAQRGAFEIISERRRSSEALPKKRIAM